MLLRTQILKWIAALLLVFVGVAHLPGQVIEQSDIPSPLLDEEPFDVIYLDRASDNTIIRIKPIEGIKKPLGKEGTLRFEYMFGSDFVLQVPLKHLQRYQTFNDLLLLEADQFLREDDFASALRNLLHVYDNGNQNNGELVDRMRSLVLKDAAANLQSGRFELALSILEYLFDKNPSTQVEGAPPLQEAILTCYDGLLEERFEQGDAEYVKATLVKVKNEYGENADQLLDKWNGKFVAQWEEAIADARRAAADGDSREAHRLSRLAERILPGRQETRDLQVEITKRFPLIVVGVNQPGGDANPNRVDHWGARRVGRLTQRTLMEIVGLGDEGGLYGFLNGSFDRADNLGLEYLFTLRPESELPPNIPVLRANQLSFLLLDHADENSANYEPAWRKVFESVKIESDRQVRIFLRRPFVRPAALLRFAFSSRDESGQPVQNGPYAMTGRMGSEVTFEVNSMFPRDDSKQNPVIIEEYYKSTSEAAEALLRGQVDIIDRPSLSDIKKLKSTPGIAVRSYAIPTVHFLIPKIRGDYKGVDRLLQALSVGINRELIIEKVFGAVEIDGCEALSGPFPVGTDESDQVSYAYNLKVKPLQSAPTLSSVLVRLAQSAKTRDFPKGRPNLPSIVLAHPASSTATRAALNIAQSWNEAGIATTLRKLDESVSHPDDDNWDVLYVEAAIEEPLTDAGRIMGPAGLAKVVSPPVESTLQKLGNSITWQEACRNLRLTHRQIANDLSVIPLYQIKEHFAYRKNVYGLGRDLIHLYENVQRWRIKGFAEEEE